EKLPQHLTGTRCGIHPGLPLLALVEGANPLRGMLHRLKKVSTANTLVSLFDRPGRDAKRGRLRMIPALCVAEHGDIALPAHFFQDLANGRFRLGRCALQARFKLATQGVERIAAGVEETHDGLLYRCARGTVNS